MNIGRAHWKLGRIGVVVWVLIGVGLAGCASIPILGTWGLFVRAERPFVIVSSDQSHGWGFAAHPYLCRLSDRRLAMTYGVGGDGVLVGKAAVDWPAYTDDDGLTWKFGDPYQWAAGIPSNLTTEIERGSDYKYNAGLFFAETRLTNGVRLLYEYLTTPVRDTPNVHTVQGIWSQNGESWHGPRTVSISWRSNQVFRAAILIESSAAVLTDGTILTVGYAHEADYARYSTVLFASTNSGESFSLRAIVASPQDAPWGNEGPCEPALLALPNGELLCVMRTGAHGSIVTSAPMLLARSKDGGFTWSHEKMRIPGVMPKLLRMSNGVIVLAFGRPGNNLVFSLDGGRSWGREVALTGPDVRTSGYCDLLEVAPNRILVVYDMFDSDLNRFWLFGPNEVNGIIGRHVNITWHGAGSPG